MIKKREPKGDSMVIFIPFLERIKIAGKNSNGLIRQSWVLGFLCDLALPYLNLQSCYTAGCDLTLPYLCISKGWVGDESCSFGVFDKYTLDIPWHGSSSQKKPLEKGIFASSENPLRWCNFQKGNGQTGKSYRFLSVIVPNMWTWHNKTT